MVGASEHGEPVGTLLQGVRRDFSGVGYGEAMRRAREIVPILRERAQRAEDARMLIRDNEQLLHESGLSGFTSPRPSAGWSSTSWRSWTSRRSLRAAARPRPGAWATWPAIIGSSDTMSPRPSAKCGMRIRTH